jgi:hypothetical protein
MRYLERENTRAASSPKDLVEYWEELRSDDAGKAYEGIWKLASIPAESIPLLKSRLRPVSIPDRRAISQWIRDLDSEDFRLRENAARELEKMAELAEPGLADAAQKSPSLEVRRHCNQLLNKLAVISLPDQVRTMRAIEVLEKIGTIEAKQILEPLTQGAKESRLTEEAAAALQRIEHRERR